LHQGDDPLRAFFHASYLIVKSADFEREVRVFNFQHLILGRQSGAIRVIDSEMWGYKREDSRE